MANMKASIIARMVAGVAVGIAIVSSAAPAAANTAVYATFFERGEDIPLRYGTSSYGKAHIDAGHKAQVTRVGGWDNHILNISTTLDGGKCGKPVNGKITCNITANLIGPFGAMRVVYVPSAKGMPDGRPKGIITAFYP